MNRDNAEPSVRRLPGERTREWIEHHHRYSAPSEHAHEFAWDVAGESEGPFCTDLDGNVFLDFTCHIGAAPLGYNNPKITDRMAEFDLVDPLKIAGQDFYAGSAGGPEEPEIPGAAQLMERLVEVSSQYDMDTVFLSNSGAEAIENAMKISYANTPERKYGITFLGAFHGRTLGTLSMTRAGDVYTRAYPETAGTRTVPFCEDRACEASTCSCGFFAGGRSQLERMLDPERGYMDPREVAFLILEPIQGVGGYRFPSEAFMEEVQRVCETHDIHLIVDEIQSGIGRTGEMWASDHYAIEPDVITSAKALRSGATISRSEIFPEEKNRLGSTWGGGDLVAAAQGVFTLDAIDEYDLLENAVERGRQVKELLGDADLEGVTDVRGKGLMLAVEFDSKERRTAVVKAGLQRGLLTLGCGHSTIRLLPPLDVTEREIDLGISLFRDAIEATR
ncbi:class-III pyridoxal-phosphate-dependent aminotransferase [Halalkalicoccus jeotgali]|uniref:Aminotransferase class-III n=1 Tax=Halalkalicoccus jeotgali (strain DSM 18796 / CECT 7217 / JCM 14584 / KCTC 4019 / B3) TaxID=795797 RepID=D8J844_HALJB|nr:aminotransferase class III-fold pyridoxal phosphate-dependent enzyme [Halalkalicoccus jeotgali]ADJ14157.1 aminotransferase class-III [Halalkalicoccus jeotgali B3]ELY34661.1 class III aminotransferase [Halalkalicoccus jeotgali B3]